MDTSTLRSKLKTSSLIRERLLTLWDHLKDFEAVAHQQDAASPGVEDSITLIDETVEMLSKTLDDMMTAESEIHMQLTRLIRK